ncbi:MAG: ferritin [Burkholderiaceae bacterium]|jgi:bacterioferritin|nr:ferritin-like domain-containing protein [Pseudomonadota bacterium]MDP4576434.1 ferritin [Burkholderiaceae bacterium]MDP4669947.1 ferritin [Burkholderiaceae bacterium]MDP4800466.1 ferritin [Burkholderiaceae bacterium]
MSADPRTLGWLNRALAHELSAVQQLLAQSVLARRWGDEALSKGLRHEATEELAHAELLMERLILMGVSPAAQPLSVARLGRNADELLLANRGLELEAIRIYKEALLHANRVRDTETASLMASILDEEKQHLVQLDAVIQGKSRSG